MTLHSFTLESRFPQGHGFIAAIKINLVSYMILVFTLEIKILLSSKGSLNASKIDLEKCGNSSKNKIRYS